MSAPATQPRATRELCIMACVFCRDPVFQLWATRMMPPPSRQDGSIDRERDAKTFILNTCHIASRNDLDTNPGAAWLFHEKIRLPFLEFKNNTGD